MKTRTNVATLLMASAAALTLASGSASAQLGFLQVLKDIRAKAPHGGSIGGRPGQSSFELPKVMSYGTCPRGWRWVKRQCYPRLN